MRATEDQLVQIRRRAVNDTTREIMAHGLVLTWDQAKALGDETLDWVRGRLGLNSKTTDAGIVFTPPKHYSSEEARRAGNEISDERTTRVRHSTVRAGVARTRTARKIDLENRAISGLPVSGQDVAVVSRDQRSIKLRHVWPDNIDARVWAGIKNAVMELAQEIANKTRRPVEVYAKEGWMMEQVQPEH
jgi:hypothetical protein